MKYAHFSVFTLAVTLLLGASISFAQQAPAPELYHIHVVKAAPGKLTQLIDAYKNAPGPAENEPQFSPIILRHREGAEWDLIVVAPLGKQTTITAAPAPQAIQDYYQRLQPLSDWHSDTFAVGPAWAEVQKALVPAKDATPVYQVTDYLAVAGQRAQLRKVLEGDQSTPGRNILFSHAEGASWNYLTVTRYDSWAALGAPAAPAQSGTPQPDPGMAMREYLVAHHDTITVYVSGGQPIR
jgi:hypothetical protein